MHIIFHNNSAKRGTTEIIEIDFIKLLLIALSELRMISF